MRKSILALSLMLCIGGTALPAGSVFATPSQDTQAPYISGAAIVQTALQYVGYPYTTVGNSPATGFSCIGFVSYVYQANGIPMPDDLWSAMASAPAVSFSDLLPGDVLFFQNTVWPGLSHTAIYLGGGRFVHAEWYNRGVVTSSFTGDPVDGDYWIEKYLGAIRPWGGTVASSTTSAVTSATTSSSAPSSTNEGTTTESSSSAPAPVVHRPVLRDGPRARVQVNTLNVRVRPSLYAPVGGLAAQGTSVVILKQYGSWDWIQLPDGSFGWVTGLGIGVRGAPHTPGRLAEQALPLTQVEVNGLRVHSRPGLAAPVIASAYRGQHILVLQSWNGWLRVVMPDGLRGWLKGLFVGHGNTWSSGVSSGSSSSDSSQADTPTSVHSVVHTESGKPSVSVSVRLRARPGLHGAILGLAVPGVHLRVLDTYGGWARVRLPNGQKGWVDRSYMSHSSF